MPRIKKEEVVESEVVETKVEATPARINSDLEEIQLRAKKEWSKDKRR